MSDLTVEHFWCCQNEKCNWDESCDERKPKEVPVNDSHIYGKTCPECGEDVFSQPHAV